MRVVSKRHQGVSIVLEARQQLAQGGWLDAPIEPEGLLPSRSSRTAQFTVVQSRTSEQSSLSLSLSLSLCVCVCVC